MGLQRDARCLPGRARCRLQCLPPWSRRSTAPRGLGHPRACPTCLEGACPARIFASSSHATGS
eukprot:8835943-Alexandrium_andersonii.AAC.1